MRQPQNSAPAKDLTTALMKGLLESRLTIVLLQTATLPPEQKKFKCPHPKCYCNLHHCQHSQQQAKHWVGDKELPPTSDGSSSHDTASESKGMLEAPSLKPIFTFLICRSIFIKSFSWYSAQDLCSKARLSTLCKYCCSLLWLLTHTPWQCWSKLIIPYVSLRRTREWWQNK